MNFNFDIRRARDHLKYCINTAIVKQCPLLNVWKVITCQNKDTPQKKCERLESKQNKKAAKDAYTSSWNHAHGPHENIVHNEKPNSLIGKYFSDQEKKRNLRQHETITDRFEKTTDELLNKMEKAKLKKRMQRSKISDLQRENNLLKDRYRKKLKT